jgi:hypothetical protein
MVGWAAPADERSQLINLRFQSRELQKHCIHTPKREAGLSGHSAPGLG